MKIGIEEEFLVVDPDTLFYSPGAFLIGNRLIYQNGEYFKKSSVELPLNSESIKRSFQQVKKGFSVVEIKTDPHENIEELRDELKRHRKKIIEVAEENNLYLIPAGLHPLYSSNNTLPDNCAALHIHIENKSEKVYSRILNMVPFLISISTNSPFYNGKFKAMSTRALISPHMGAPVNRYKRTSDLIINKSLNTVEIRTLDIQVTLDESIGIAEIVKKIAEEPVFEKELSRNQYKDDRKKAINDGKGSVSISDEEYEVLCNSGKYAKQVLESKNGSSWQMEIMNEYDISSVVYSLWESFKKDKKIKVNRSDKIEVDRINPFDLLHLLPYSPFFFIKKFKKYRQDLAYLDEFESKRESLFSGE